MTKHHNKQQHRTTEQETWILTLITPHRFVTNSEMSQTSVESLDTPARCWGKPFSQKIDPFNAFKTLFNVPGSLLGEGDFPSTMKTCYPLSSSWVVNTTQNLCDVRNACSLWQRSAGSKILCDFNFDLISFYFGFISFYFDFTWFTFTFVLNKNKN